MHAADFLTSWDAAIFMAPFFGLLALWMFGLDERVTAPRDRSTRRRFCQSDANDDSGFCDPDGKTAARPTRPQPPLRPMFRAARKLCLETRSRALFALPH